MSAETDFRSTTIGRILGTEVSRRQILEGGGYGAVALLLWKLGLGNNSLRLFRPQRVEAAPVEDGYVTSEQFFPETSFFVRDGEAKFLSEFYHLGGIDSCGYPISRVFEKDGFPTQAFQRAILQWRNEGYAVLANTMDELHKMGKDGWLDESKSIPRHFTGDDGSGGNFERAKEIRLPWLENPEIKRHYLNRPDAVNFFGLPTSRPERRGPFVVQRFQRYVLQLWLDAVPGMPPPGQVVGALVGDIAKEAGFIPQEALQPEAPPAGIEGEKDWQVPLFRQEYPLSCEAASASMVAHFRGKSLSEDDILARIPFDPNPNEGFRGRLDGPNGSIYDYGVYAKPIAASLRSYGLSAEVAYNLGPDDWRRILRSGRVGIAWLVSWYAPRPDQLHYPIPDHTPTDGEYGELVPWEHAVAVRGFNENQIFVNDPAVNGTVRPYPDDLFRQVTDHFNGMAVVV